ncbi:helix-turn-helix domain-containing protein [Arundinibacter roseus]|uniref:DNA-binding protein n=1 Tax=Arundinibacter roseus TaxID=2070510 RepID=A0A4R4KGB8_9BACT|nr:helix-turn-helix domain-containing protein [Arundinibacter roseus]TDB67090.1 DNA-binding protein [Arundinibacter roseus]
MTATTISLSLPEEQLELLATVQELLNRQVEQNNHAVWLKEQEAADRLKVSLSTIRKWRGEGWLRYIGIGENIRYRANYLDDDFEAKGLVEAPLQRTIPHFGKRKAS